MSTCYEKVTLFIPKTRKLTTSMVLERIAKTLRKGNKNRYERQTHN